MKEVKPSKKPLLFYYSIVLLCVVLFNAFIAPMLMDDPVKEVDYGTFMRMVDNKEVDKVQVNTNEITFMDKEGKVYYTSAMEDPDLTQRLYESGAAFDRVIEKTMSPLVSYLITGVLPIILFVALGQYLYKRLMSQAGGKDSLMFGGMGKSNAKIYIQSTEGIHFSDVAGEDEAKESLAEVVDYLHNPTKYSEVGASMPKGLLLVGPPGTGKTMLAKSMPSILPELTFNEALEITKIQSITGIMEAGEGIASERPFRSPHHSASTAALVGGGQKAMPGEISLAHYGVLFLDEFPEFSKDVLESLRQPLEDGVVTITRASAKATYPADFMLIAAMNPCPCGYYGSRMQECRCKPYEIAKYRNRISGPLLDRLDMHVEMAEVGYSDITSNKPGESSAAIRERVDEARRIQRERYKKDGIICNAQLSARLVKKYCVPDENGQRLMRQAYERLNLSARAYNRVMKVARTIADLSGGGDITYEHIAEAIQYRTVDKKYWGE